MKTCIVCGIIIVGLWGCEGSNSPRRTYETLTFNVDSTRLEPTITDSVLKIEIASPKGWKAIDDAMLTQVVDRLGDTLTQGLEMAPRLVFVNDGIGAMCVVSGLEGVKGTPDETLLKTLDDAYSSRFPTARVQRAIFRKGAFRIHQLMVVASDFVLIKLICDTPEISVFEVDYVVPSDVYQQELRAIESSIGSLNLINHSP